MSDHGRRRLFVAAFIPLAILLGSATTRLPRSGHAGSRNGDLLIGATLDERHTTDVITAINFDYRGFDTLGEEFILFSSVMGVVLLLRRSDDAPTCDDEGDDGDARPSPPTSDAVRVLGLALFGFTLTYGLYVVTHGQLTPGGGFQGGIILATAWVLLYLGGTARLYRRLTPRPIVEAVEAVGGAAYALIGAAGVIGGSAFLANIVPLGPLATVTSGGTIALLGVATGLEVAGGFVLMITAFVDEALDRRGQRGA